MSTIFVVATQFALIGLILAIVLFALWEWLREGKEEPDIFA